MDLKDIKAIIDLMKKNSITEFELERQEFKIRLKRGGVPVAATQYEELATAVAVPVLPGAAPAGALPPASGGGSGDVEIKSPMIGTFYRAPSPESGNYVEVGAEVNADTVVCIIEAMKVMNEIKAEKRGVITRVLVEDSTPVQYESPLFEIQPA